MNSLRCAVALHCLFAIAACPSDLHQITSQPATFSFSELIRLASVDPPPPELQHKLNTLLTTPFIDNRTPPPAPSKAARPLHVAEWNINRGEKEEEVLLALSDANGYLARARDNPTLDKDRLAEAAEQVRALQEADIVVLDEVDDGVKRTKYHNVALDLADALHMNFAYAVEFIELNRIYMGIRKMDLPDTATRDPRETFGLDPERYLGLEGSAILSRYPIQSARIVRLLQEYDWYHGEIKALSDIEKVRRWTAKQVFDEQIKRQVRRGGRMALIVDLQIPGSPAGVVTVVCPHLEDYCGPKGRRAQIQALLPQLAGIRNPVILAGDMNTLGHNGRPLTATSALRRYVLNYRFWARQALYFFLPIPAAGELFHAANYFKNLHDPTAFSIPLILRNPARRFFTSVRAFRFEDGGQFDFSGSRQRSFERRGSTLADTNQRAWKGFVPTFAFNRTFGGLVGTYKIDWLFIKTKAIPGAISPPELGRTLDLVNTALGDNISDHCPILVTVPLQSTQ